jgi:hypothetical protein
LLVGRALVLSCLDELITIICHRRSEAVTPMVTGPSLRWRVLVDFFLFRDGSSSMSCLRLCFSRTCAICSPSSPSPKIPELSSLASGLAWHRGLLGQASTPTGQSFNGTDEKYIAWSYPRIFKNIVSTAKWVYGVIIE